MSETYFKKICHYKQYIIKLQIALVKVKPLGFYFVCWLKNKSLDNKFAIIKKIKKKNATPEYRHKLQFWFIFDCKMK